MTSGGTGENGEDQMTAFASDRRGLLGWGLAAGLLATGDRASAAPLFPVVETAQGNLRGVLQGGVAIFRGVRYGASTHGANRFMPPRAVAKWSGVRDALSYSDVSPQVPADRRFAFADLIMVDHQPAGPGEDCLALNIWSPTLDRNAKKPVIVVLHGGGFYGGSGNSTGMDGEMMARFGDSVVVSVNHRLGAFGFLHLAEAGGEAFARSGAVGMMDIVAALGWVRENIEGFGGDPGRVLVFGQSGGGAKTSALLAMPGAKGLFHRAGVMSGSALRLMPPEVAVRRADALLKALEIGRGDIAKLQALPWQTLLETQARLEAADRARGEAPGAFAPVIDGVAIPRHPFDPDAPAVSADVPMIVSTVLDERSYRMGEFDMDRDGLLEFARKRAGAEAERVVAMYRDDDPQASPFLLAARMDSDIGFRLSAFRQAELKAAQGRAPVWSYLWTWPSPAYGGRYGAVHGIDVAPSLHNIRGALNGPSAESRAMADRIASIWAAFAASGDPDNKHIPQWAAYDSKRRATLILDQQTRVENDPRGAFRNLWLRLRPTGAGRDG